MDNEIALVKVALFCVTLKTSGRKRVKLKLTHVCFLFYFSCLFVFGLKGMLAVSGGPVRLLFQLQLVV